MTFLIEIVTRIRQFLFYNRQTVIDRLAKAKKDHVTIYYTKESLSIRGKMYVLGNGKALCLWVFSFIGWWGKCNLLKGIPTTT